ncbi:MAG: GFA family protein [Sinobacteraceae bacterium]|nr:GFA family protein [Nevskiaceae bacterium]
MTTRIAHCACRQLQVETEDEPLIVSMCHCTECQRRTGSPFGLGAWYPTGKVKVRGETRNFVRPIEGRTVTNHFCPHCGGTVMWEASKREGLVAVAVGMFADPEFPPPARSIFEEMKHPWVEFRGKMDHLR